jgi:hypothetical protein
MDEITQIALGDGSHTTVEGILSCDSIGLEGLQIKGIYLYVIDSSDNYFTVGADVLTHILHLNQIDSIREIGTRIFDARRSPSYLAWMAYLMPNLRNPSDENLQGYAARAAHIKGVKLSEDELATLMRPYVNDDSLIEDLGIKDYQMSTGEKPKRDIVSELIEMVRVQAIKVKLTHDEERQLRDTILSHQSVFSTELRSDAALVEPLKVELRAGATPLKTRLRSYTTAERDFMRQQVQEMVAAGLLYRNDNARWVAPVLVVPKPGKVGQFRLTVDLRWVNQWTVPLNYGMPNVKDALRTTKGAKFFFSADMLKGFWQVELNKDSCHLFSFMTPDGVYTPTRLPMGGTDSPLYFQAKMSAIFEELLTAEQLLLWVDDTVVFSKNFGEYIAAVEKFLSQCEKHNLIINIDKTVLVDDVAVWCGYNITEMGTTMQPRAFTTFEDMAEPKFAGELGEFLHALRWMQGSILRFQERSQTLWDIFQTAKDTLFVFKENTVDKSKSMKKRNYAKIRLSEVGWNDTHSKAFQDIKKVLSELMRCGHLEATNERYTTCVFTDASKRHYGGLLTQVLDYDASIDIEEQNHEPLGIINGEFNKVQKRWSVIEREAYPLIMALREWREAFMASKGIRIYTDHANLVSLFRPEAIRNPELSVTAIYKVYRWLYDLAYVRMLCMEHLPGLRNRWADIISRWGHPTYYLKPSSAEVPARVRQLRRRKAPTARGKSFTNEFLRLKAADASLGAAVPSLHLVQYSQGLCNPEQDTELSEKDRRKITYDSSLQIWRYRDNGPFWVPSSDLELITRFLVTAHISTAGHRTSDQMFASLN